MTCPGLTLALRHVAVLAVSASVACTVDNQAFMFDTNTDGTGTGTAPTTAPTTDVSASSVGTADTGVVDTGLTGETTGPGATVTSDHSGSTSGSTSEANTDTASSSTSDTGPVDCGNAVYIDVPAAADAFFIAGSTNQGTTCNFYGGVPGGAFAPCYTLNLGTTSALQFAKHEDEVEAMYAIRFEQDPLIMLQQNGFQIAFAQLNLTGWGLVEESLELEVGLLGDTWDEGGQNGTPAVMGDSSFEFASYGIKATAWTGGDGPRGASEYAADIFVDIPLDDHFPLVSTEFTLGNDFVEQLAQRGLSVSYPIDTELFTYGPGLKSREAPAIYHPFLRIFGCMP